MFNIGPGELVAILVVALIVLGPNRLPDAVRTVGRVVGELRRISGGFQDELRNAFDDSDVIDQLETGPTAKPATTPEPAPTGQRAGEDHDVDDKIDDEGTGVDTAAAGLSGVTASTERASGSEDSHDDLDGDGTDGLDDMDHIDDVDSVPGTEDPPETDQRAAS
jgi:sec-independent protein translocase protein TatB